MVSKDFSSPPNKDLLRALRETLLPALIIAVSRVCYVQVNLLVAIPMAVVDLGVSIAVALAGLAWLVIGPVMDIVQVT